MSAEPVKETDDLIYSRYLFQNRWKEYCFILAVLLSQVFTQGCTYAPLVQFLAINDHYGASELQRGWFQSSFALSTGVLILISGRFGDVFGLKATALWGYGWSIIWTILLSASYWAENINFYIICRAFQGAGMAFVLPNFMGVVGRIYRPGSQRKSTIFVLIGVAAPIGAGLTVLFSGLITQTTKYFNWAYWVTAIAMGAAMALAWWTVPNLPSSNQTSSMDWIGCGLVTVGLVLLNFTFNQAPVVGWQTPYIIALLVISVVCIAVFVWYELHVPSNPLIPQPLLRSPRLLVVIAAKILGWGSFGVLIFHYFTFVEDFRHYNPLQAGASQSIVVVFGAVAALTCGLSMRYFPIHFVLLMSMCCFCAANAMLAVTPVDQSYFGLTFGIWIVGVFGMDWSFPSGSIVLSEHLPPECQGMAGSLINAIVNYSNSLFLGMSQTVSNEVQSRIPGKPLLALRSAMYFGVGLSAMALFLLVCFTAVEAYEGKVRMPRRTSPRTEASQSTDLDDETKSTHSSGEKSCEHRII